ncbi:MAG: S46 family peptidase, partial [bacterium]|nr:S46 family peptidase [bacterium]
DIRLVFAPEASIAAFGGDPDNFTYPRYCLDFAFFRVYEHGRPAATPRHLPWSRKGAADGELTFVPGHPGSTGRLLTVSALEFSRDVAYPLVHQRSKRLGDALLEFSGASEDNTRIARDNLLGMQNSLKAYTGFLAGLHNDKLMVRKRAEEKELRDAVMADAKLRAEFGSTWDDVSAAYAEYAKIYKRYRLLESYPERGSEMLRAAILVLRYAEETTKPNEERLREFAEAALPSVRRRMYSPAPIEDSMEIVVLTDYLRFVSSELGADDPTVKALLDGASPAAAARKYVESSKLKDVDERKRLAEDLDAVRASTDGMIHMARILDQPGRKLRKIYEDKVEAPVRASGGLIAAARYAVRGAGHYPDATFTLRLSYGPVKGYENAKGKWVPWSTNFKGLYRRATGDAPFRLPPSWIKAKDKLDLTTPYNFVTTNDTHGGNSGSPTINTKGEVVGIIFDSNIEGLPNRFVFTDAMARSVHVTSQGITEALVKIY